MADPVRILLVEDDPNATRTIWNMFHEKSRFQFTIEATAGLDEAITRLTRRDIDVVLLDLSLVSHQAETDAVQRVLEAQPQTTLLVITELENDEAGLRALEAGAQDYLLKEEIGSHALVRALHYAVERQRAGALIHAAEERNSVILNNLLDYAIITFDKEGTITDWSKGAEQVFGYPKSEVLGQKIDLIFTAEDRAAGMPEQELKAAAQERVTEDQRWLVDRSGNRFYVFGTMRPLYTAKGQVEGFVKILRNNTEHYLREETVREKRAVAEALRDTAMTLNGAPKMDEVLKAALIAACRLTTFEAGLIVLTEIGQLTELQTEGFKRSEQDTIEQWFGKQSNIDTSPLYQPAATTRNPVLINSAERSRLRLPKVFGHSLVIVPLSYEERVIGYLTLIHQKAEEFPETDIPKLQALGYQVVTAIQSAQRFQQAQELAVLQERHQIARELHDAVSQTLYSASIILEAIVKQMNDSYPQNMQKTLGTVHTLIQSAMAEMRTLLLELRPTHVYSTPFSVLLRQLTQAILGRTTIDISMTFEGEPGLPPDVHLALYRITQEAMSNILKHAQATQIWVSGQGQAGSIDLEIRDNGQGFVTKSSWNGMGLGNMRERAKEVKAQLTIQSAVGEGTDIHIVWPGSEAS